MKKNEKEKDTMALTKSNASYKSANTRLTNINKDLMKNMECLKTQVKELEIKNYGIAQAYDKLNDRILRFNNRPWYKRLFSVRKI